MAECPKKDICARYSLYLDALEKDEVLNVLNANLLQPTEDGCPHFIVAHQERHAFGFRRLARTIPVGNTSRMDWIVGLTSDSTFYRYKRGERPIPPKYQELILRNVKAVGGDPTVGFDRYEDVTVYRQA